MDEPLRTQMIEHLSDLRTLLAATGSRSPALDATLLEHIEELEALITGEQPSASGAQKVAEVLERKLLGWEAEHPQLVALASRVARALENAGL